MNFELNKREVSLMKRYLGLLLIFLVLILFAGTVSAVSFKDSCTANTNSPYVGKVALQDTTVEQYSNNRLVGTTVGKVVSYTSTSVKFKCYTKYVYTSPYYNHIFYGNPFYKTLVRSAAYTDVSVANTNNPYIGQKSYNRVTTMTQIKNRVSWKTITTTVGVVASYSYSSVTYRCAQINRLYVGGKLTKTWAGITSTLSLPIQI